MDATCVTPPSGSPDMTTFTRLDEPYRNAIICRNDARRLVPQVVQSLTSGACLPIQPFLQHDRDLVSGLLRDRCL
jgi:hypothetical protein